MFAKFPKNPSSGRRDTSVAAKLKTNPDKTSSKGVKGIKGTRATDVTAKLGSKKNKK